MRGRMADNQLTCRTCGSQFIPSVKTQVYCGRECKERRPRVRTPKKPLAQVHICLACDKPFHPKARDRTTFCGRECGLAFTGLKSQLKASGGRVWVVSPVRRKCAGCASRFVGRGNLCDLCKAAPRQDGSPLERTCIVCSSAFLWESAQARPPITCSGACARQRRKENRAAYRATEKFREIRRRSPSRRAAKKLRKAIARGASGGEKVDPLKVFERDAWRCGICGQKTLKSKRGTTHPRAPELDHIVALANGGDHSYRNVQCACRQCNGAKGASDYGQLHLFAAE